MTPAQQTSGLATTPKFITNWNASGTQYLYVQTDTKLYQVLTVSPYTVTDVTAQITPGTSVYGAIIWKGVYVYSTNNDIRANTFPVASGSDVQLKSGYNGTMDYRALCIGADGNLYYGDTPMVGVLTSATGTSGNTTNHGIDNGYTVRDLVNDGRYLVIFADNNQQNNANCLVGNYSCKVYFWDMVQTDGNNRIIADAIYDFADSYIIGAKMTDNGIEMITYNGVYVLSSTTRPKMIRPFPITPNGRMGRPLNPSQIIFIKGSLYWVEGFQSIRSRKPCLWK